MLTISLIEIIWVISLMKISLDELNFIGQDTESHDRDDNIAQEPAWVLTLLSVSEEIWG